MTAPHCPRCGAAMTVRHRRDDGTAFWGCATYPRCKGTQPREEGRKAPSADTVAGEEPARQGQAVATLHTAVRQLTRERDTLRAGYDQLLDEVRQLRRRRPGPSLEALVRELTRLLTVVHPDRWGGESAVATALTQELLALRDRLREKCE